MYCSLSFCIIHVTCTRKWNTELKWTQGTAIVLHDWTTCCLRKCLLLSTCVYKATRITTLNIGNQYLTLLNNNLPATLTSSITFCHQKGNARLLSDTLKRDYQDGDTDLSIIVHMFSRDQELDSVGDQLIQQDADSDTPKLGNRFLLKSLVINHLQ